MTVKERLPLQLWCLHGNLQTPDVWRPLQQSLQSRMPDVQILTENLWETMADSCWDWAERFCQRAQVLEPARRVLLGYSLGGRLGLHAVLRSPHLWAGALIVAADPGLVEGRAALLDRDRTWAHRFLTEPWPQVMADWNRLPLFAGRPGPDCDAAGYRPSIAAAFTRYSKGRQTDLRSHLQPLRHPPLLYLTGSEDTKYTAIGQQLEQTCPTVTHCSIPAASHRVPWDNASAFHETVFTFLKQSERCTAETSGC
ncbi:MAG: alpha/beta fold hydrolase [Cyanobacteria bacterium J06628_6]